MAFAIRTHYRQAGIALVFTSLVFAAGAAEPYNREHCYGKVKSLLGNGTLAKNDTIFHRGEDGLPLSKISAPVITLNGCYEMCGTGFGWYTDIGPRLATWLIPIFLLISNMEVSPLDKRRYLMILHLLGDPIDSLWSLMTKLEAWSRCYRLAQNWDDTQDRREIRNVATILGGFEELVGFAHSPLDVFRNIRKMSKLTDDAFKILVSRTAQQLADCRTDERLRTLLATMLYVYQVVSAFVAAIGGENSSPPGGRIGIAMFMTWIVPSILLSNAIGGFPSRRTCYSIMEGFVADATGEEDAWVVLQQAAPALRKHETVHHYFEELAWSGAIYSYRPEKSLVFSSGPRDVPHWCLLLLAAAPLFTSSSVASVLLWNTPPVGLNCRNILIFVISGAMIISAALTRISTGFSQGSWHWHGMLMKDVVVAIPSMILIFVASAGRFNSCWCWSGVFSRGNKAHVPLNAEVAFGAYNRTTYPTLVGVCLMIQFLVFVGMIWAGWQGWNLMRWGEDERKAEWKRSHSPLSATLVRSDTPTKTKCVIQVTEESIPDDAWESYVIKSMAN